MKIMESITRPALRYTGSKWLLSPWIIDYFVDHLVFLDAFGGSASMTLRKTRSEGEIYNDLDGDVVNYFKVLRERPDELIRAIHLTPFAEEEFYLACTTKPEDPLERARLFYAKSFMAISGPTGKWKSGFRRQKKVEYNGRKARAAAKSFAVTDHLYAIAERMRGVTIERMDIFDLIETYDTEQALWYFDPPYVFSTRGRWSSASYRHEMDDLKHIKFLAICRSLQGHVYISGYNNWIYEILLHDWPRIDKEARVNGTGSATESLWIAPHTWQEYKKEQIRPHQPTMF